MAYCTVSIGSGVAESIYGNSQFPIKSYIEHKGEGFEKQSVLPQLFRMDSSTHFAEKYSGDTAMDDFVPVGEGGAYPQNGFEEGYSKILSSMTWKSKFDVTQEMVEDATLLPMRKKANGLMTAHNRTREEFGRYLYAGGLKGTTVQMGGKTFDCSSADGKALFAKDHPNKIKKDTQSNLYAGDFTAANLSTAETIMQNRTGDNGELLSVTPDTILIPNDGVLKNTVFSVIGADKDPGTSNNAYNYHYGRWNVIVDPYLTRALAKLGITYKPWILLDSQFNESQDGAVFIDRVKLAIKSVLNEDNANNVWKGRSRFSGGFVDWRFALAGGVTGGSDL